MDTFLRKYVSTSRRARRRRAIVAAVVVAAGVLLGWISEAQAIPRILRPGTRNWVFVGGFGPSLNMHTSARYYGYYYGYPTRGWYRGRSSRLHQFKLMQEIGGHFTGDAEGPALGASFEEAFANGYFRFETGPKFWWDIQPVKKLGLYIAPEARLGFGLMTDPFHAFFNIQTGCTGKLILDDRGIVFLRPITLDFLIGPDFYLFWDIMMGGGVTW